MDKETALMFPEGLLMLEDLIPYEAYPKRKVVKIYSSVKTKIET